MNTTRDSRLGIRDSQTARILIIAGSDSGGGAGIQADIKTVTALGGYAATAITTLTAQNTLGVHGVHPVPEDFIAQQMACVLDDIGADAIKTGMLHSAAVIEVVADVLGNGLGALNPGNDAYPKPKPDSPIPLVLDPVMVAKGGAPLLEDSALEALKTRLIPLATLVTPNIPEAEILSGMTIQNEADMREAGKKILDLGAMAVLIKGGHLEGDEVVDLLVTRGSCVVNREKSISLSYESPTTNHVSRIFRSPRIDTRHTHGTGCTLASAIATFLAKGLPLEDAVKQARAYVWKAIWSAPGLGQGHGPLHHGWNLQAVTKD